jgi:hypothetical protein
MTGTNDRLSGSVEILIGELMNDDELRGSFLRNPRRTLRLAGDWGLPLTDSELDELRRPSVRFWDHVVEELESRLSKAA